jgi:hypothetical protein
MSKVEFKIVSKDLQVARSTDDKYLLLSLFIEQFRFRDNIQEIIDMLESVRHGKKTWSEANDNLMFLQIGYDCGGFKCNKDTAYFIADNSIYQDLQMSLQEVIDIMKEWKRF